MKLIGTILPPNLPISIPASSKWLSGQGAGGWFSIEAINNSNEYRILRYTPEGLIDCDRVFKLLDNGFVFDLNKPYEFVHVSHCSRCRVQQNDQLFIFEYYIAPPMK